MSDPYIDTNRDHWDRSARAYQERHADQLRGGPVWGVWAVPESRLNILGDVAGKDVLEFGCGAAEWSLALARTGARATGLDLSDAQLGFAREAARRADVEIELVCGNAECTPFDDASFDVVFCDHGAMTFADPRRTVPEAARLLRPGGLFAFNMTSPLLDLCWDPATEVASDRLHEPYFGMHRLDEPDTVSFNLPYGEWVRLFRAHGLRVEDLIEIRPDETAVTTYEGFAPRSWARRWPAENVWKLVRE